MEKKILIGLAGPARVGKDTAAKYLSDTFLLEPYALASPIKAALDAMGFRREVYDNDEAKDLNIAAIGCSYRKLAQTLGTEWGRSLHPNFWINVAQHRYNELPESYQGMVVSDVRFNNEAAWIRRNRGIVIHIHGAPRAQLAADGVAHASEAGIEREQGDVIVSNTGSLTFLFGQLNSAVHMSFGTRR